MKGFCLMAFQFFFLVSSSEADTNSNAPSYPIGDIRNCPTNQLRDNTKPLLQMDVLPGLGFDNLRNLDLGQVYNYNFSTCQTSADGLYLLPDNVRLIPILHSHVDYTAQVFDHYSRWKSETSHSLNVNAKVPFANINAKFSSDYQKAKSKTVNDKSRSTRIGLRYNLYTVDINPDAQLSPLFKSRIFDLAANIQNNNTKLAHYLAELLVRDYGTHVVTSIDAGAMLSQTTFFQDQSETDKERTHLTISASASASFFGLYKIGLKYTYDTSDSQIEAFQKQTTSTYTTTHGGPPFRLANFSYADWENKILDHLVAIDRRGEPLYSSVTTANIPELPAISLVQVNEYIYKAISRYYKINTHSGCTTYTPPDPLPENFNFHANVDDGSCEQEQQTYTFGGIYQTCENMDDYDVCQNKSSAQKNPLTSDYTCPVGYINILLHTGTLTVSVRKDTRQCHRRLLILKRCNTVTTYELKSATYKAYWCGLPSSERNSTTGLLFGGVYTSTRHNVLTGKQACPRFFFPLHFGEDMEVCVSSDAQGNTESLKFGGFYSCSAGNPMAASPQSQVQPSTYPKHCPVHYNQLMLAVDEDCLVNYCVDIRQVLSYEPQPPILPPFKHKIGPAKNVSNVLLLTDTNGGVWAKQDNGQWAKVTDPDSITTGQQLLNAMYSPPDDALVSTGHKNHHYYSNGEIAGIVIGSAIGSVSLVVPVLIIIFGRKKLYKWKKRMVGMNYEGIGISGLDENREQ